MAALVFARGLRRFPFIRQISTLSDPFPKRIHRPQVELKNLSTRGIGNKVAAKEIEIKVAAKKIESKVAAKTITNKVAAKKTGNKVAKEKIKENKEDSGVTASLHKRQLHEKLTLNSYLNVCVDGGLINVAFNTLIRSAGTRSLVDVQHFNIVLKGWARLGAIAQIAETRMHMIRNNINPNMETFLYVLLAHSKNPNYPKSIIKNLSYEMKLRNIDPRSIFHHGYLNATERNAIKNLIKNISPKYYEVFMPVPIQDSCKLLEGIKRSQPKLYDFAGSNDLSQLESWAEHQRSVEAKTSVAIESIVAPRSSPGLEASSKLWLKFEDIWRKAISKNLDTSLAALQDECSKQNKVHIYPYICSIDRGTLIKLLLDEIEVNAACTNFSQSTRYLHSQLGTKVMVRYFKTKAVNDGSSSEIRKIYNDYLSNYCKNPRLMGQMNSREYIQSRAAETKNYAVYRDILSQNDHWPQHIVVAVGRFLYAILLREVKFDLAAAKNPGREIDADNLVPAFYSAYFQVESTHRIKEEFRANKEFENFYLKACSRRLKMSCSFLPSTSPPLPWLSHGFGGYLTSKFELVRSANAYAEQMFALTTKTSSHKLYPSLDSLNAISLCPWIVNKDMLDIVINLFKSGGDASLKVPEHESKMQNDMPTLKDGASKADRILYTQQKKKHTQKKREMYSLWRDCLYRLSIANHFRDRMFWLPHNMDFRGRTYPIPPHFNHLGADLARSLLLFAKGRPLGDHGLDWLKIHLINLTGSRKKSSKQERLEYANSILHMEVLDSADNPWDGRRWWQANDNPWQVLACCKEISKAIRSRDPKQYVSHFPVHQDGSCNGLQHYAALGRDPEGAMSVNLIPCDRPQDVYSRIVDIVEDLRKKDADRGIQIAISLEGFIVRKVIKQTVMTTVYGVTRYGARTQIAKQLVPRGYPDKQIWSAANYLSSKTFEAIGQIFNKSNSIQHWFTDCAGFIAKRHHQPVSWETPLGFPVTQPYTMPTSTSRLSNSATDAGKIDIPLYNDPLSSLNISKQRTAFPPNYIHSLDSSHMMLTSLYCQHEGLTFVSVHDCFWTHPDTVDVMNRICREQFVVLHSQPLLQQLSDQFVEKYGSVDTDDSTRYMESHDERMKNPIEKYKRQVYAKIITEVPETGELDLNNVLKSTYFFS